MEILWDDGRRLGLLPTFWGANYLNWGTLAEPANRHWGVTMAGCGDYILHSLRPYAEVLQDALDERYKVGTTGKNSLKTALRTEPPF